MSRSESGDAGGRVLIVQLDAEGGSTEVYGCESAGVWAFWSQGSSLTITDDDLDEWQGFTSKTVAELAEALPRELHWFTPLKMHPDFAAQLRVLYDRSRAERPEGPVRQHEKWQWLFNAATRRAAEPAPPSPGT